MGRRRNPGCTCNACCPRCSLVYNEPYCSVDWDCSSCCGSDYEDNQRYLLVALNEDTTTYADYGDVGKSGRLVGVRGKTYRLTVEGPDCYLNRVYTVSVPATPCRACPDDCTPNPAYTTHSITGWTDIISAWISVSSGGTFYNYRESLYFADLNHTRNYDVSVGLRDSLCPYAYVLGERYLVDTVTTKIEAIAYPGAPWEEPLKTATATWDVYGFWEFTTPTENPVFRLAFVLQAWDEFTIATGFGPRYFRAPFVPSRSVDPSPPVGMSGYTLYTKHAISNPPNFYAAAWCSTTEQTIFFTGGLRTFGYVRWIGGVL